MKHFYLYFLFIFFKVSNCITELLSVRISDVGTVTPHAIVGYCILQWLTSIQDVPTELLEGSFVVDRLFPCSLSVFVCVCLSEPVLCKQDLPLPWEYGWQGASMCMTATYAPPPGVIEYGGLSWQLVRYCLLWFFCLFLLDKERIRVQIDFPNQPN